MVSAWTFRKTSLIFKPMADECIRWLSWKGGPRDPSSLQRVALEVAVAMPNPRRLNSSPTQRSLLEP